MVFRFLSPRYGVHFLLKIVLAMSLLSAALAQAQTRILFVGNSFTHGYVAPVLNYNAAAVTDENYTQLPGSPRYESDGSGPWGGVPGIFKKFADQAGLAYTVHMEVINGVPLEYHYDNALSVIQQSRWDRVVLQELSTRPLPTNRGGDPALFFDYSTRLEQAVHSVNAAAKVYLFETWARADLTYLANQSYAGLPIDAMAADLHDAYYLAATQNGRFEAVAPVGDAWLRAIQAGVAMRNPYTPTAGQLDLWASFFHASKWGSYLSACVLFGQITGVDPRTLGAAEQAAADLGIGPTDATALQRIAYEQLNAAGTPVQYALTLSTSGSGTVTKSPDQPTYTNGSTVTLAATLAAGQQFTGWGGDATGTANPLVVSLTANRSITANFAIGTAPPPQVTGFTLVNADTEQDIQALSSGTTLNLATLPTRNLNVRASTSPATVGSVAFALSGPQPQAQTDAGAPYALLPDTNGNYPAWTPAVGSYSLTATPYAGSGGSGQAFYRAININGGAIVLDGQSWASSSGAASFQL